MVHQRIVGCYYLLRALIFYPRSVLTALDFSSSVFVSCGVCVQLLDTIMWVL